MIRHEIAKHITKFTVLFITVMLVLGLALVFIQYASNLAPSTRLIQQARQQLIAEPRTVVGSN